MISIITVSGIGNIAESIIAGWELWVIPIIIIGTICIWWMHFAQKSDIRIRTNVYFVFAAFLGFYHGVHDVSFFDVSVVALIMMATFMMADRAVLLNLILFEYVMLMAIQSAMLFRHPGVDVTPVFIIRTLLHAGVVLCMYFIGRILVRSRINAGRKLDEWKEAVRENDHDMEDFLSNISHELRTPVNVISGMTTLLQKDNDCDELDSIRDAGVRLADQIEDIQDYTEIKRGELLVEEDNYTIISLINDVVANYRMNKKRDDLEFIVDLAPDTPAVMKGDIKKLHKLFRHLIDNAVKFTGRGGIYIKVFPVVREYGVNLTIEVSDTGMGMTRTDIARVSKGMYQANKKRNRSTGGIGIGLPIVYGFVHRMGGFVKINSKKGRGSTVRLSIPQDVIDPSPCLAVKDKVEGDLVFYIKPEKYTVPEIREYYRNMSVNLATGLKARLYSAGEPGELERLIKDLDVSYIFTGEEEYTADHEMLDELSAKGCRVVVSANDGFRPEKESGVLVMQKPLYGFPVVCILNGEENLANENTEKVRFTGVSALVVDDEPMNLVVATGLLREYRMFADTAESGREAVEKYRNGEYDVVFMDHMMPGMDGVEAMKHIREAADESGRKPVIIALTANALSGAKEMFTREGFDGFIAKPINLTEFERVMKRVLPEDLIKQEGRDEHETL